MRNLAPYISHIIRSAHVLLAKNMDVSAPNGPCLIIAPHPDDETLGCGTVIIEARQENRAAHIVVVTDGSASTKSSKISPPELAKIRKQETMNACKILGVPDDHITFLGYEDEKTNLHANEIRSDIEKIIKQIKPGQIFSPYIKDIHPDHATIANEVRQLALNGKISCPIYEYPVWSSVKSDAFRLMFLKEAFALDRKISKKHKPAKLKAIYEHKSQLENLTGEANWATLDPGFIDKLMSPEIFFKTEA